MKRVAIPVRDELLSETFGTCNHYEVFEIDKEVLRSYVLEIPAGTGMQDLPELLERSGMTDVIAYQVDKQIISLFASRKVDLFVGVRPDHPEALIDQYLRGRLESDPQVISAITGKK
ncbi:MAG: hypothetical protein KDC54_10535 [Lewinella sp.]|nr:hypothetical protein [Lewinella sp.]